ncbi:MAG: pirin family protein [Rothia sp. (in: high G+C Gram-positive bacteria)]|uniref:pirin family protein n=1 Tax=Rothia sp. (in: high G+C Gram-positive bacteria) TaxID=1885016 RepID=UPI0026E08558|nr:pirin family protein [Rothia sp. (in: high G+C Gram-positive bacteria)]MDO5750479.1 pirin family protein [Rothia sp. (in: high G+C Gram-positive bacteria)]
MMILDPRPVPLGGLRAMEVRRLIPAQRRRMIGAWCFIDHYGPDKVPDTGGMRVVSHPHIGLQTVSWLFTGAIEHRDSLGTVGPVLPGEVNLMTAGHGINHSEFSTSETNILHGIQLWVALPAEERATTPKFENYRPQVLDCRGVKLSVFLGSARIDRRREDGSVSSYSDRSPVHTFSPLLGAEIRVDDAQAQNAVMDLHVEEDWEYGFVVDSGSVTVTTASGEKMTAGRNQLLYFDSCDHENAPVRVECTPGTRTVLLGGEPFGEEIIMWWNFVGRTYEEIVQARQDWQDLIAADNSAALVADGVVAGSPEAPRFGPVVQMPAGYPLNGDREVIPAPALPGVALKPRGDKRPVPPSADEPLDTGQVF